MRIVELIVTFERGAMAGERRNLVRKDAPYGPLHTRSHTEKVNIETGPDSGANVKVRLLVQKILRREVRADDELFYVVAAFKEPRARKISFYRTIVPRTEVGLRRI